MSGGTLASAQQWEMGARGGFSHSDLRGGQEFVWKNGAPTASIFIRGPLVRFLWIQPEVSVRRREGTSIQPASTLTLTANYLDVPLLLQLRSSESAVRPYIMGGPGLMFRLSCTLAFSGGGINSSDDCDSAQGARSNRLDVGVVGGGGIDLRVKRAIIGIEGRVTSGLRTNVLPVDVQGRAYGWSVSAGISTPLRWRPRAVPPPPPVIIAARNARPGSLTDAQIAAMILAFSNTDISYGRLAPRRAARDDVRSFARQMVEDHIRVKRAVYAVLERADMGAEDHPVSVGLRDESTQQRDPMYFIEGQPFDSSYADAEVRIQREFLSAITDLMLPSVHRPELRALLLDLQPQVALRLGIAERLRATVARPAVAAIRNPPEAPVPHPKSP